MHHIVVEDKCLNAVKVSGLGTDEQWMWCGAKLMYLSKPFNAVISILCSNQGIGARKAGSVAFYTNRGPRTFRFLAPTPFLLDVT